MRTTTCSTSWMVPVPRCGDIASALLIEGGSMVVPAAVAIIRKTSRLDFTNLPFKETMHAGPFRARVSYRRQPQPKDASTHDNDRSHCAPPKLRAPCEWVVQSGESGRCVPGEIAQFYR